MMLNTLLRRASALHGLNRGLTSVLQTRGELALYAEKKIFAVLDLHHLQHALNSEQGQQAK